MYDGIVDEGVPDRFAEIVKQLEASQDDDEKPDRDGD